jgi:serine/threonine protein kinase
MLQGTLTCKPILGDTLPACMVYERGEPLHEWSLRTQPDTLAVLHMLCAVAERIADVHAAGFVHRDIKPANILWQPSTRLWTLLDYGCAAPLGMRHSPFASFAPFTHPNFLHSSPFDFHREKKGAWG